MGVLRFRLGPFMALVPLLAIDLVALRAMFAGSELSQRGMLVASALPMANIVAVCAVVAARRPERRPFCFGFAACGIVAILVISAGTGSTASPLHAHAIEVIGRMRLA